MAWSSSRALVLALVVATTAASAATPAPAPAPAADCMGALVGLAGCLSYVEEGSNVTTPDPTCCSGLKDVVRHQVACLCQLFQGGAQNLGISLNMTKALKLPAACKVKTPPVSKCHVSDVPGVPSASPVPAPEAGAPFSGQSPSSPAPSGSPAAAATGSDTNTPAPSPAAHTGAAGLSASPPSFFSAAAAVAAALLVYRVL